MKFDTLVQSILNESKHSNFHGFDVKIIDITPGRRGTKDVHFSVDGYPTEHPYYEYVYDEANPEDGWFSDNPEEFSDYVDNSNDPNIFAKITADFNKLVKAHLLKKDLSDDTAETFGDML